MFQNFSLPGKKIQLTVTSQLVEAVVTTEVSLWGDYDPKYFLIHLILELMKLREIRVFYQPKTEKLKPLIIGIEQVRINKGTSKLQVWMTLTYCKLL
jgi:hypothetical protein